MCNVAFDLCFYRARVCDLECAFIAARDIFCCLLRFKEPFALTVPQKFEELNKYPDFNNYLIFVLTKLVSEGKERSVTQICA